MLREWANEAPAAAGSNPIIRGTPGKGLRRLLCGDNQIFEIEDVEHHAEPVEWEEQNAKAGGRGGSDDSGEQGEGGAEHIKRTGEAMAFVNMAETGNDAEGDGHTVAKTSVRPVRDFRCLHPVALWAGRRMFEIQRRTAERTSPRLRAWRIGFDRWHVLM